MKKIICSIIVLILVISTTCIAFANNSLTEINQKIDETKTEISGVKSKMSANMKEVDKLIGEISSYQKEIENLEKEIAGLNDSIEEAAARLEQAKKDCEIQEELLQQRLIVLYEAGETSYLDVLLGSDGLIDFISTYYLVSEIAQYDVGLLEDLEQAKLGIEVAKQELEENKEQVEVAKKNKQNTSDSLKSAKQVKDKYAAELSEEEKDLKGQLEEMEADKKIIEEQIRKAMQNSNNPTYAGGEMAWPVPGVYYVSCEFGGYSGHMGIDIAGASGSSIVAANAGVVVTSDALKNGNTYRSYGEYIIIDHGGGVVTLYAHGYPGSRQVKVGDKVTRGQTIMKMGTTGNSSGDHLHFEVRVNGVAKNPRGYI